MAQFDPRRRPLRFAPHLMAALLATAALGAAWHFHDPAPAKPKPQQLDATTVASLEAKAFAASSARPGLQIAESVRGKTRPGESWEQAVRRLGVAPEDATAAAKVLKAADVGVASFQAAIAKPREGRGSARLVGLTLRTGPATSLTLSRTFDGAMKLRELEEKVSDETTVAHGKVNGSLFNSAAALGATSAVTNQVVKLFAHKLDFSRDVVGGDDFTLVFDRRVTESGRTIEVGQLMFAEIESRGRPTRLYRFIRDGKAEYFDEFGKNIRGFLLRTPVDGARMSGNFGMRRHPILGYMRMHQGIDFAAGSGTPVVASGDGVVVEARRWGGYGNWLRIRHSKEWDTGYGHLLRYAPGIRAGTHVRQGQVVAYVGSTGASTGPHLHYETWFQGKRTSPIGAKVPQGTVLAGTELAAFNVEKAKIDGMVERKMAANAAAESKTASVNPLKALRGAL
jgi:murein DD-endopeptidase MepM/ murein hydrolase activator NlpD